MRQKQVLTGHHFKSVTLPTFLAIRFIRYRDGVFAYNYLSIEQTGVSFQEVHRLLKTDGRFIFCVPHPSLPFIKKEHSPPFYFAFEHGGYFSNRDVRADGKIWRRDGQELPVEMHHKLLKDYFDALRSAGFSKMPEVEELGVTEEILNIDPKFLALYLTYHCTS